MTELITKDTLIQSLRKIKELGWVKNARPGNAGGVGNTLEDLLGLSENNLPIPNAAEWELKSQRSKTTSLTTLFHMEPSPRAIRFVPNILLPLYGWGHQLAGTRYDSSEKSFRQTISGSNYSDRGFTVKADEEKRQVLISFNSQNISDRHVEWKNNLEKTVGLGELDPRPYWGFDDLGHKAGTKLINTFFVLADNMFVDGVEYFHYNKLMLLSSFSTECFINAMVQGKVYIDFDARTGHNHGTKFRLHSVSLPDLYSKVDVIF